MRLLRHRFRAMGSPCALHLYGGLAAVDAAVSEVARLERKYSRYRADSLASRINRSAGDARGIWVDEETALLLDYADVCHRESGGAFDITSGVLRHGPWALPRVGWWRVRWEAPRLVLPRAGMEIDFGGYVKEYAADRVAELCRRAGAPSGLVDLGGDLAVIGPHPDGEAWVVGIRDPARPDCAAASIAVYRGAVATSGNYERYMVVDGKRYGHLLDPRTGWPVESFASVSVVAGHCLIAGTASTIAMLRGLVAGAQWLEELGLPHLRLSWDGELAGTLVEEPPRAA